MVSPDAQPWPGREARDEQTLLTAPGSPSGVATHLLAVLPGNGRPAQAHWTRKACSPSCQPMMRVGSRGCQQSTVGSLLVRESMGRSTARLPCEAAATAANHGIASSIAAYSGPQLRAAAPSAATGLATLSMRKTGARAPLPPFLPSAVPRNRARHQPAQREPDAKSDNRGGRVHGVSHLVVENVHSTVHANGRSQRFHWRGGHRPHRRVAGQRPARVAHVRGHVGGWSTSSAAGPPAGSKWAGRVCCLATARQSRRDRCCKQGPPFDCRRQSAARHANTSAPEPCGAGPQPCSPSNGATPSRTRW